MSKPGIPIKPIDFDLTRRVVEEFSNQRNVPTHVYPAQSAGAGEGRAVKPVPSTVPRTPTRKFTVDLPEYVIDAIMARALQARPKQTARYIVLAALRASGIDVAEADLVKDGRRSD